MNHFKATLGSDLEFISQSFLSLGLYKQRRQGNRLRFSKSQGRFTHKRAFRKIHLFQELGVSLNKADVGTGELRKLSQAQTLDTLKHAEVKAIGIKLLANFFDGKGGKVELL